jgi:hypothetical protein
LVPIISGKKQNLVIYSELPTVESFSIIEGDYKLIFYNGKISLFNISKDYKEYHDIAEFYPEIVERLMLKVNKHFNFSLNQKNKRGKRSLYFDKNTLEQLKALGYIN